MTRGFKIVTKKRLYRSTKRIKSSPRCLNDILSPGPGDSLYRRYVIISVCRICFMARDNELRIASEND